MVDTKISEFMCGHHKEIDELFDEFKKNLNTEAVNSSFRKFKWELEKHFFVEEKAIFTLYNPKDKEEYTVIPYVLEEHSLILDYLRELESSLKDNKEISLDKFEDLLNKHKHFEDRFFYPKLDKNLTDSQKEMIMSRIKEIIE